ncbi:LTA synthase family protein [Lactococcus piscium]|uniref:LTA synthase family protein n=1 Tax=Pseudolactococcus carnosus TaxID=2749961 RepID=UPI001FBB6D3A|nr:LTA synthase family protein [Lactococcus carnosus]MCJ1974781.1 LTA synthase family protein [Lactococcus carnosus]MCJ1984869.1 LTA synthase family protein [Lactococcus carnosus]MCJ2001137.1 LTA synthase family protein [Lactococcus carnosus]MCJ2002761.1 LTA synthase family protein [Lactococcus carnosus]
MLKKFSNIVSTRLGFTAFLVLLFWLKSLFAYFFKFDLDFDNSFQILLAILNPLASTLLLLGLALYVKNTKLYYSLSLVIYFILTLWLFSNATYFGEFTDFITVNTMLASSKVAAGLGQSALNLFNFTDLFFVIDFLIIGLLMWRKVIRFDHRAFSKRAGFAITSLSILAFTVNLFMAEIDRPELLSRGFSNTYVVRYLGLVPFTVYDGINTYKTNQVRKEAKPTDVAEVQKYVSDNHAKPNPDTFGIAKGKNVIYIHLESFQQFLINYKLKAIDPTTKQEKEYEVTPFLNSLFGSKETFAFDNFFHQVKAGKTSDAETLMENSFFGLTQGSFFVSNGGKNTFQSAPDILSQVGGYTSAVFHGNVGSFWNRNETYKRLGYNYFFDQTYFNVDKSNSFQYGLHDKFLFGDSIEYLEHLQQPFYTKFITVSNHYPYVKFAGDEGGFPLATTSDDTINGYFATANYLDTAVKEFFDYLKASDVYKNSVIVLYGDHYGISNSRNPQLAELLGKNKETWSSYDDAMLQRVPYMIVVPGMDKGGVNHTFGGEIDNLPTLLHLLGIDNSKYPQLGQDLLSPDHRNLLAMRNTDNWVSSTLTNYSGRIYKTATGEEITNPDPDTKKQIDANNKQSEEQLKISDAITTGDLLRFWPSNGLKAINPNDYNYTKGLQKAKVIEKKLGDASTSIFSQNGDKTTKDLWQTQSFQALHPELNLNQTGTSGSSAKK